MSSATVSSFSSIPHNTLSSSAASADHDAMASMPPMPPLPTPSVLATDKSNTSTTNTIPKMPLKKRHFPIKHSLHSQRTRKMQIVKRADGKLMKRMESLRRRDHKNYGHVERVKFALFLKVLMQHLMIVDEKLHLKAQTIVRECTKSQREGKLAGLPLMCAIKGRLYGLVGNDHWILCERYLESYLEFHQIVSDL